MILTVTLNAALDVTYRLPRLRPDTAHRVDEVATTAGGKGVNVARVLHALGHRVLVTGFAGGETGRQIRAELTAAGVDEALYDTCGAARRTVTVVAARDGTATAFNEPGPAVTPDEWAAFLDHYRVLARDAAVVALSGSLPRGLAEDAYATLIAATDAVTILDTSGAALSAGVGARPDVVKPNADELAAATGDAAPLAGARRLRTLGAGTVVASRGADGMLALTDRHAWRAACPGPVRGNPTGAGDAAVAALAAGLAGGAAWPDTLAEAVAVSAAAVACPVAGEVDRDTYHRLRPGVVVEELAC